MKNKSVYIKRAFGEEPTWSEDTEDMDGAVLRAINWYVGGDKKNYKKWTLEWMKDKNSSWTKEQIENARRCPQSDFKHFGHYCRMLSRGFPETDSIKKVVDTELNSLITKGKSKKASSTTVSPSDRMREQTSEFAGELMEICDKALESIRNRTDYHKTFKTKHWLEQREVGYKQAEMLGEMFGPALAELDELVNGKDKQLQEGYSFLKKPQQKQLHKFMLTLVSDCFQHCSEKKPVIKRRKRRVSRTKIASKVKFLASSKEHGVKSENPIDIIDSKKVVVYNTRYNILSVYSAKDRETMTVKGTTIQNFCPQNSFCRTIKHAEKVIRTIKSEKSLEKVWSSQHSMIKTPTGRLNENTLIVKVFK